MPDREKVIEQLEHCINMHVKVSRELAKDTLALLKEMEPIAPLICGSKDDVNGFWWYMCGKCKMPICPKERFCRRCGQKVKWNETPGI